MSKTFQMKNYNIRLSEINATLSHTYDKIDKIPVFYYLNVYKNNIVFLYFFDERTNCIIQSETVGENTNDNDLIYNYLSSILEEIKRQKPEYGNTKPYYPPKQPIKLTMFLNHLKKKTRQYNINKLIK